jgi:hypothetical protein
LTRTIVEDLRYITPEINQLTQVLANRSILKNKTSMTLSSMRVRKFNFHQNFQRNELKSLPKRREKTLTLTSWKASKVSTLMRT